MSNLASEDMTARRLTPTERLHDIARLMAERPAPVSGSPVFEISQTKATGGATVYEWNVHIPVCDLYPDAEQAFDALVSFADRLAKRYPATSSANGERSSTKSPEREARAAAAIARNRAKT